MRWMSNRDMAIAAALLAVAVAAGLAAGPAYKYYARIAAEEYRLASEKFAADVEAARVCKSAGRKLTHDEILEAHFNRLNVSVAMNRYGETEVGQSIPYKDLAEYKAFYATQEQYHRQLGYRSWGVCCVVLNENQDDEPRPREDQLSGKAVYASFMHYIRPLRMKDNSIRYSVHDSSKYMGSCGAVYQEHLRSL